VIIPGYHGLLKALSGRVVRTAFLNTNRKKIDDLTEILLGLKDSFDRGVAIQSASSVKEIGEFISMILYFNPRSTQ
jgi:hypothetical protein